MKTTTERARKTGDATLPYETTEATPTLTFVSNGEALALPYHFLQSIRLANRAASIVLTYDDLTVTMEGTNLHPLWRELQLYNVREIRASEGNAAKSVRSEAAECAVTAIRIESNEDAKEEEEPDDS
jgi:hypothetical protein